MDEDWLLAVKRCPVPYVHLLFFIIYVLGFPLKRGREFIWLWCRHFFAFAGFWTRAIGERFVIAYMSGAHSW
jgi:hypothetical protein